MSVSESSLALSVFDQIDNKKSQVCSQSLKKKKSIDRAPQRPLYDTREVEASVHRRLLSCIIYLQIGGYTYIYINNQVFFIL
jgi:hypothetical protein